MPTYQYACTDCADRLEVVQKFTDDPLTVCPSCGGKLRKVFSPVGIVFKGSGFYRTDSRASQKSAEPAAASANGSSDGKKSDSERPTPRPRPATSPSGTAATRQAGRRTVTRSVGSSSSSRPRRRRPRPRRPRRRARRSPDLPWPGTWPASASSAAPGCMSSSTPPTRWWSRPRSACRAIRWSIGEVAGRRVAFVPRHGRDHRFPPHRIPYRANLWALRSVGVRQVLAPSAVGSLTASYGPGTLAVPDQLVDRTSGRVADLLRRGHRGARPVRRPVLPGRPGDRDGGRRASGWAPVTSARWWSSRARGSPPGPSRAGTPRKAGR